MKIEFRPVSWIAEVGDRTIRITTDDQVNYHWSFNSRFGHFSGCSAGLEVAKGHAIEAFAYQGTLRRPEFAIGMSLGGGTPPVSSDEAPRAAHPPEMAHKA